MKSSCARLLCLAASLFALFIAGCSAGSTTTPTPTPAPTATMKTSGQDMAAVPPLPSVRGQFFSGSGACTLCHTQMTDEGGNDVSTDRFWRATMMANSARDPYWQASLRAETLHNPDDQAVIEDKCATCHTSMARYTVQVTGEEARVLDGGFLNPEQPLHVLAIDGVSCSLCHQIEALQAENNESLADSYSGHFKVDERLPQGERIAYGPYPINAANQAVMQGVSGFLPQEGQHIESSELCGSCHTLYTPTINRSGEISGEFPEQMIYPEWLHSDYRETLSCQDCHMPLAQGGVRLSTTGGELRSPFFQHYFVGGNAYIPQVFGAYQDAFTLTASAEQFEVTVQHVQQQIQERTAQVSLQNLHWQDGILSTEVVVDSQVGHKFPSGFPSRRAWLHFTVRTDQGDVLFESGAVDERGMISGNANDEDPARYEPHYETITSGDQVQIYEAIMADSEGEVTTTLLYGAGYLKDNRVLPAGFGIEDAPPEIAVQGAAHTDPDFRAAQDRVLYQVELSQGSGPLTVQVELLYQPIGARWADNLRSMDAQEVARFVEFYDGTPNLPLMVASDSQTVEGQ